MPYKYSKQKLETLNFHPTKIEEILLAQPEDLFAYIGCKKDVSSASLGYWTSRGWPPLEAEIKSHAKR